jgi:hypothetical protein
MVVAVMLSEHRKADIANFFRRILLGHFAPLARLAPSIALVRAAGKVESSFD